MNAPLPEFAHVPTDRPVPKGFWDSLYVLASNAPSLPVDADEPQRNPFDQLIRLHRSVGVDRALITESASAAATGHQALISALQHGGGRYRGVVRLHWSEGANTIAFLHEMGVRGVRLEPSGPGRHAWDTDEMQRVAQLIKRYDWHISMPLLGEHVTGQLAVIKKLSAPVVLDTSIASPATLLIGQRDWTSTQHTWLRLSGPGAEPDRSLPRPLPAVSEERQSAFFDRYSARLLWGSAGSTGADEPQFHPGYTAFIDTLFQLCPDDATRQTVVVDNPLSLFDH